MAVVILNCFDFSEMGFLMIDMIAASLVLCESQLFMRSVLGPRPTIAEHGSQ